MFTFSCSQILNMGCHVDDRDALTDMTLLHYAVKSGSVGVGDPATALQVNVLVCLFVCCFIYVCETFVCCLFVPTAWRDQRYIVIRSNVKGNEEGKRGIGLIILRSRTKERNRVKWPIEVGRERKGEIWKKGLSWK